MRVLLVLLLDPPPLLTVDPYRLETFADAAGAREAGATITHFGACGLCSSVRDLAIYMRYPDLTEPVRACGLRGVFGSPDEVRTCIEALGFSAPCAQIWWFNTLATRASCAEPRRNTGLANAMCRPCSEVRPLDHDHR